VDRGDTVEVRAHAETRAIEEPDLAICEDDSYYIKLIATPTPWCGAATCPVTPTPVRP
jgi:hypothetical protein